MGKLHIRTASWTEGGKNYTDGLTYCGKDVYADSPSGMPNRIEAVPMQTNMKWYRNYDRVQTAIMFGDMCKVCQRHLPQAFVKSSIKRKADMDARLTAAGF